MTQDDERAHRAARILSEIHEHLRTELNHAQQRYQDNADNRRLAAPRFLPSDKVWLNARNIRLPEIGSPTIGPFDVIPDPRLKTPYAVRLALPESTNMHPVFHVSLLPPTTHTLVSRNRHPHQ